jgi:hypothetical protein
MERIFRLISTHSNEESKSGLTNITESEFDFMQNLLDNDDCVDLKYDGYKYNPEGNIEMLIIRFDNDALERLLDIDKKLHVNSLGYTKVEDITKDVLYTMHDTSIYGIYEQDVLKMFYNYKLDYITKDDILDKICEYGISSITENERNVLQDLPLEL